LVLSNKEEGEYLDSSAGQEQMAEQIAKSIVAYNKYFGGKNGIKQVRDANKFLLQQKLLLLLYCQ
jgi:hypothetical protein